MTNLNTLADRYAAAKAVADKANADLEKLKAEVKALGQEVLEGDFCTVTLSLSERTTFDGKVAQKYLTPEQVASCQKKSLVETVRVQAKVPQQEAA